MNDDFIRSFINEFHILFLQLQCGLFYYLLDGYRHVYFLEFHHLATVVHTVEHRDVVEQTAEPFALCVASFEELCLVLFLDGRVVDDGFEIALDACHWSLQLMGDILGELSLQYVLFLLGLLQSYVYFYDTF